MLHFSFLVLKERRLSEKKTHQWQHSNKMMISVPRYMFVILIFSDHLSKIWDDVEIKITPRKQG